jgi:hypothetical protein
MGGEIVASYQLPVASKKLLIAFTDNWQLTTGNWQFHSIGRNLYPNPRTVSIRSPAAPSFLRIEVM